MMREQLEIETRTENILTEETGGTRLIQRLLETLVDLPDLAMNVVVTAIRAHGEGGDCHAFDDRMRVVTHDVAILERPGLAFIGITDNVLVTREGARHERPLQTRREAGATTTTQDGLLNLSNDVFLSHLGFEDTAQLRVTTTSDVILQAPGIVAIQTFHQHAIDRAEHGHYLHSSSSLSICSGCMWLHIERLLTINTGASPQAPMHSPSLRVNLPSAVVSP